MKTMSKIGIRIFGLVLCMSLALQLRAQVARSSMIGAYVYNFSRYITWPNEHELDSVSILVLSQNQQLIDEFKSFAQKRTIKNKPIRVVVSTQMPKLQAHQFQIVMLGASRMALVDDVARQIHSRPVLMITENLENKRNVMINLYDTPTGELRFEVNRANMYAHQLKMDPEILLLGGNEIDIAELYRNSQRELDSVQNQMVMFGDTLKKLQNQMESSLGQINLQNENIRKQDLLLEQQVAEIVKVHEERTLQQRELNKQHEQLSNQQNLLSSQAESIQVQAKRLSEHQKRVQEQEEEIERGRTILDGLGSEIDSKNKVLKEQDSIIEKQKQNLLLLGLVVFLSFMVLVLILLGLRNYLRKNHVLAAQKAEIEKVNSKLEASNKSLYSIIAQLKETQSQLVSSEKMASLGVLTAGIAHEINNPVNFIYTGINSLKKDYNDVRTFLQTLRPTLEQQPLNEEMHELHKLWTELDLETTLDIIDQTIDDIAIGAERTTDIVRGLRDFSRIDKDAQQWADVHEGINSALLLLRNKFKNRIQVVKEFQQIPRIECYPGKLNQAFLNILSNAIDAIKDSGTIWVRTRVDEDVLIVEIEDSGEGISPENLQKIFDPFFTTKVVGQGVGLGLSITFGIIKEHGGSIEVKSTLKKGSIFKIGLPIEIK
jgi:signal transduction histidine kinase